MTHQDDQLEEKLRLAMGRHIEQEFPNPNRNGCPDHSFLGKAATAPTSLNQDEIAVLLEHVLKCGPCFKELKSLKQAQ